MDNQAIVKEQNPENVEEVEQDEQEDNKPQELTKNQKRNQKKKEKKKKLKEQNQEIIQQVEGDIKNKLNIEEADSSEAEIAWCIKQIKLGLTQQLTPDEVKISVNMIELLESDNVPMAKKRMVMKNSFGDYRKLMKQYK